jgi:hypothetical protein
MYSLNLSLIKMILLFEKRQKQNCLLTPKPWQAFYEITRLIFRFIFQRKNLESHDGVIHTIIHTGHTMDLGQ